MANKEIDKRTLLVFADAVRNSENRLRDYYRHLQESSSEIPESFRRQYGGVRRIKDVLQRHVDANRARCSVVFSDDDANLLASCLADALPELDQRLAGRFADEDERKWLEEQRQLLMNEAKSLLTEPMQAILALDSLSRQTPSVRALQSRLPSGASMPIGDIRLGESMPASESSQPNSVPPHQQHPQHHPQASQQHPHHQQAPQASQPQQGYSPNLYPGAAPNNGFAPGGMPMQQPPQQQQQPGMPQHGGMPMQQNFGPGGGYQPNQFPGQGYQQQPPPQQYQQQPGYAPQPGYGGGPGGPAHGYDPHQQQHQQQHGQPMQDMGAPGGGGLNLVRNAYQQMDGVCRPEQMAAPAAAAAAPEARPANVGPRVVEPYEFLFDPNLIRDHRVRAQVRLDLQDLVRAQSNDDLRLSLVHLGSLLEGLLLDYGLRNRKELTLGDGPDLWDFHALAIQVFGQSLRAEQEPILGILHACRRLLRPSCQVVHPILTTAKMVEDAMTFAMWALEELGFVESQGKAFEPETSGAASSLWRATNRDA